ncbi:SiaB family protein kinase [Carboxylicivirga sp. N1Y90]|uniref:SiaB family protein kinase n=1 Tax=Carboxylicivirga fragile TaxID=3417571 RepID=UPI003D32D172|nr:SiaB family protein kinase [Marinilabiliaceae bacterium N1Y90]
MTKINENQGFLDFAYQMYKSMKTNEINLVYEGEVTQEITKTFTSLTEKSLAKTSESNSVQRKVFNVMVECLQNISKHADSLTEEEENERRGIVMVSHGEESYNIITGNVIKNEKVPDLKKSLEHVNSLDKKGLSDLYKQQMREGKISEKGGAGLGFIDIAKKSGSRLNFQFKELNDEVSFFILTSTIKRS